MRVVLEQPAAVANADRPARMSNSLMPTANDLQEEIGTLPITPVPKLNGGGVRKLCKETERSAESVLSTELPGDDDAEHEGQEQEDAADAENTESTPNDVESGNVIDIQASSDDVGTDDETEGSGTLDVRS